MESIQNGSKISTITGNSSNYIINLGDVSTKCVVKRTYYIDRSRQTLASAFYKRCQVINGVLLQLCSHKNSRKVATLTGIFLLSITGLTAVLIAFWAKSDETEASNPHYLVYQGTATRIYLVSATSSYIFANQTYTSTDRREIPKGSRLFAISVILRNDYTNEDPPPSIGTPVSPVDGTAYICLNFTLHNKDGTVSAINVTPADFTPPSTDETGLILASGQTNNTNIYLATNQTNICQFEINLVFVGDSIPS